MDRDRHRAAQARPTALAAPSGLQASFVVAAPIAWFAYNAAAFGDWLEFARGPYSAKAIELRTASPGAGPPHPGWHNPWVSLSFFVKASEMDAAAGLGQHAARLLASLGTLRRVARRAPPRILVDASALAAGSLLCVLGCLRLGAHLFAKMVAALLVQHALRNGTAARLCTGQPVGTVYVSDTQSLNNQPGR
jgi:hypothetical protein